MCASRCRVLINNRRKKRFYYYFSSSKWATPFVSFSVWNITFGILHVSFSIWSWLEERTLNYMKIKSKYQIKYGIHTFCVLVVILCRVMCSAPHKKNISWCFLSSARVCMFVQSELYFFGMCVDRVFGRFDWI